MSSDLEHPYIHLLRLLNLSEKQIMDLGVRRRLENQAPKGPLCGAVQNRGGEQTCLTTKNGNRSLSGQRVTSSMNCTTGCRRSKQNLSFTLLYVYSGDCVDHGPTRRIVQQLRATCGTQPCPTLGAQSRLLRLLTLTRACANGYVRPPRQLHESRNWISASDGLKISLQRTLTLSDSRI